jgi:alkanesulfonate monooxygenase SsuD/methylene tetrahydromethanopterin reductase-like flavin-dependent oxidoreductase (luciferase family)
MRFGLFGSAQARRGGPDVDSAQGYREFIDYSVESEALGYYSGFIVEHHFTGFGQVSASLNLLTWIAARTSTLRVGTAVIVLPWHNPVLLAEQAATLDLLSGGRLDFGIGRGYRYNEFAGFRIPMSEADARFEESLDVIMRAWTSDKPFSHRGRFWSFDNIVVEPPTAQKPHPPLWAGAGSPASIRHAAEHGHNLLLDQFASFDMIEERFRQYKETVEAFGRTFDPLSVAVTRSMHVSSDRIDTEAAIARRMVAQARVNALARRPDGTNTASIMANAETHEACEESAMYGPPEQIARKIERLRNMGVRYLLLNGGSNSTANMRRFAKDVMPAFAD